MNHLHLIFPLTLLSLPLSAVDTQPKEVNQRLTALEEQLATQQIYGTSAGPHLKNGYHLTLTGDFLWWKAQENGLEYALWTDDPTQTDDKETQKLLPPEFHYDPGFRAALGYQIPRDSWDVLVEWTRFHTTITSHRHIRTLNYGLLTPWTTYLDVAETPFVHAGSHLHINLDMIDAELGRHFYTGKRLSMRPSLGLRAVQIDQYESIRNDTFFVPPIWKDQIKLTNDYRALGPKVSLDTTWDLLWGLNLYGSGTLSLLYGEFKLKRKEHVYYTTASMLPTQKRKTYETLNLVRAMADLQIGLGWDITFMRDRLHFSLKACWEQMLFFGQNQFLRLANPSLQGSTLSNLGDLSFQGGTLSARLDF